MSLDKFVWDDLEDLGLAKAFDPNQPRDEDGKWSETGESGGRPTIRGPNNDYRKQVQAGLNAMPTDHAARIAHVEVHIVENANNMGYDVQGFLDTSDAEKPRIFLSEKVDLGPNDPDFPIDIYSPGGLALHEVGHAVDYTTGNNLSQGFTLLHDKGLNRMTEVEFEKASYYTEDQREMFAELYMLKYNPDKTAGWTAFGMKPERAREVFVESLAALGDLNIADYEVKDLNERQGYIDDG